MTPTKSTVPKAPLLGADRSSARQQGEPPSHGPLPDPVAKNRSKSKDPPNKKASNSAEETSSPTSTDDTTDYTSLPPTPPPPPPPTDEADKAAAADAKKHYPNAYQDPDPLPSNAPDAKRAAFKRKFNDMGSETLQAYQELELFGNDLWLEFISTFRPHYIKCWEPILLMKWTHYLRRNGVHVDLGRASDRKQKLIDVLYRDEFIEADPAARREPPTSLNFPPDDALELTPALGGTGVNNHPEQPKPFPKANQFVHPDRAHIFQTLPDTQRPTQAPRDRPTAITTANVPREDDTLNSPTNVKDVIDNSQQTTSRTAPGGPPGDDDDGDDERDRSRRRTSRGLQSDPPELLRSDTEGMGWQKGLGIGGLMKAYHGKPTFAGSWEEDLENCVNVFNTLCTICELTPEEKLKAVPVLLRDDALNYYSSHSSTCVTFDDAISLLRAWYNSDDRRFRILAKWHDMKLSHALSNEPNESEVTVFRKFIANLMSLQKQLDTLYHDDRYLRDRLLTAIDIPHIQAALRDRLPRNSQQAINRVAVQLSEQQKSAGITAACLNQEVHEGFYSLNKSYHGDARRQPKRPYKSGSHHRGGNAQHGPSRRLNPNWMRGVKGCFLCGKDHRANTKHPREEVTAAINRLKAKHPSALISIEDLHSVMLMSQSDNEDDTPITTDDNAMWLESEDQSDNSDVAYMCAPDAKAVEVSLANNAFMHGH